MKTEALNTVITALQAAIARYEAELVRDRGDQFVYCWTTNCLCVAVENGKSSVVGPEQATCFGQFEPVYKFRNGKGEYAVLIPRSAALQINLRAARKAIADFQSA
jgi:hypothetical protein